MRYEKLTPMSDAVAQAWRDGYNEWANGLHYPPASRWHRGANWRDAEWVDPSTLPRVPMRPACAFRPHGGDAVGILILAAEPVFGFHLPLVLRGYWAGLETGEFEPRPGVVFDPLDMEAA